MKSNILFRLVIALICALLLAGWSFECNGQSYCGERFPVVIPMVFNTGGGLEMGTWPTDEQRLGFTFGMGVMSHELWDEYRKEYSTHPTIYGYLKGQFYLIDHLSLTGMIGEKDMFADIWYGMGLRAYFPTSQIRRYAFILEPMYTNLGFKVNLGLGIAIN